MCYVKIGIEMFKMFISSLIEKRRRKGTWKDDRVKRETAGIRQKTAGQQGSTQGNWPSEITE